MKRKGSKRDLFINESFRLIAASLKKLANVAANQQSIIDILRWRLGRLERKQEASRATK